jgi:hypothetical protein
MELHHQTFTANMHKLINIKGDKFWDGQAKQGTHVFRLSNNVLDLMSAECLISLHPHITYCFNVEKAAYYDHT